MDLFSKNFPPPFKPVHFFRPSFWIPLAGLILILAGSLGSASSEEIRNLKEKMAALQNQIKNEETQKKNLALQESQLTKNINSLKKEAKTSPNILLNLRIESALKELRSILVALREKENRRSLLQDQLIKTKEELDIQMEYEINRFIQSAKEAFHEGNEKEADRHYKEALHLMEEHKQFQSAWMFNFTTLPSFVEILLDGKESPEKLRELADFARNDIENIDKEIRMLQENKNRVQEEISLRKNLVKYPGLLEREENPSTLQIESIEQELIQFEKINKMIENRIMKYQSANRTLSRKIREIQLLIQQKEN